MQTESPGFYTSESEFESRFRELYAPLCRYAATFVQDPDEAEDIVQKIFIDTWEKKGKIQVQISQKSYLYRAVYNACVSLDRHKKIKHEFMEHNQRILENASDFSHQSAENRELEKQIRGAVNELPEQCGRAFRLSRNHQLSYAEIAQVMNISVKTVEQHIGKALGLLRKKLAVYLTVFIVWLIFNN